MAVTMQVARAIETKSPLPLAPSPASLSVALLSEETLPWGAAQDAVVTPVMTHSWRLMFREMKELAHGSRILRIGFWFFLWSLPACLKEPCR